MVIGSEVPAQDADGGQRQRARGKKVQDDREALADLRDFYARAGGIFRQVQYSDAIAEDGGEALGGKEAGPRIERHQVSHEIGGRQALLTGESLETHQKLGIGERGRSGKDVHHHSRYVSRRFSGLGRSRMRPPQSRAATRCARAPISLGERAQKADSQFRSQRGDGPCP
jgi:hypothetical protein